MLWSGLALSVGRRCRAMRRSFASATNSRAPEPSVLTLHRAEVPSASCETRSRSPSGEKPSIPSTPRPSRRANVVTLPAAHIDDVRGHYRAASLASRFMTTATRSPAADHTGLPVRMSPGVALISTCCCVPSEAARKSLPRCGSSVKTMNAARAPSGEKATCRLERGSSVGTGRWRPAVDREFHDDIGGCVGAGHRQQERRPVRRPHRIAVTTDAVAVRQVEHGLTPAIDPVDADLSIGREPCRDCGSRPATIRYPSRHRPGAKPRGGRPDR